MKFNLKNRPQMNADPTTNEQQTIEWFEGLEKELKEICTANAEWRDDWFKRNPRRLKRENPYLPVIHVIQQILGEAQP